MLVITQENLKKLLQKLGEGWKVFDTRNDRLPFKKYFFPPVQETFSSDKKSRIKTTKSTEKFVLFGLNSIQLEALTQLDEIMSKPHEDFFYWQRRKQAIVIGSNDKNAKKFIEEHKEFFEDIKEEISDWSQSMRQMLLDSELLAKAVEWSWKSAPEIWEELGQKCLGCGICTYVCPLCHCFSIEDRAGLDDKCSRCRKWDACTLPNFAKISGGHSFRPTLKERYYNWFYHKFVRAYKEYGKSQCVGCGACKRNCPAGIDIKEVLEKIINDYKKQNG